MQLKFYTTNLKNIDSFSQIIRLEIKLSALNH